MFTSDVIVRANLHANLDGECVLFDRIEQRRIECGQPHDSLRLGANWARRRAGLDLNVERFGTFCSVESANPADDQLYGAKWLTDLEGSYRVGGYRLAIGAQNLFSVFPDRNSTVNSFNGIETFPRHSPFGMNGRVGVRTDRICVPMILQCSLKRLCLNNLSLRRR